MSALHPIEPGDAILPGDPPRVSRYREGTRVNHWITAAAMVLLILSGLSMAWPPFFFLSALFGGGQFTRFLHPWIGLVLVASFALLARQFWRGNLWNRTDIDWLAHMGDLVAGREEKMPEVGKYNAGQKAVFWSMSALIIVLISSGLIIWDQYFSSYSTLEQKRIAVLVHSVAAIMAICVWIVHVYAAIWVRGTIRAMTRGSVTGGWAWKHHRKWLRELVTGKTKHGSTQAVP